MFCRRCQYDLQLLSTCACPECGESFNPDDPSTYLTSVLPWWRRILTRRVIKTMAAVLSVLLIMYLSLNMAPTINMAPHIDIFAAYKMGRPGFRRPVFKGNLIVMQQGIHQQIPQHVTCYDPVLQKKRWTARAIQRANNFITDLWPGSGHDVLIETSDGLLILDSRTGKIVESGIEPARIISVIDDSRILMQNDNTLYVYDQSQGRNLWSMNAEAGETIECSVSSGFAFVVVRPDFTYLLDMLDNTKPTMSNLAEFDKIDFNSGLLHCISVSDGLKIWEESFQNDVDLLGPSVTTYEDGDMIVCSTVNDVRILRSSDAAVLHRYHFEDWQVDGAVIWQNDKLVVCLRNPKARMDNALKPKHADRQVRIYRISDNQLLSEFSFKTDVVDALQADRMGDVLLMRVYHRLYAVDLKQQRLLWMRNWFHTTQHNGKLYFGGYEEDKSYGKRIFGTCDPKTGKLSYLIRESCYK